jgi:hypothetical protein
MSEWIDGTRCRQEPANYTLQPRRDLLADSIGRVNAKIQACFTAAPKFKARIKEPTQ